MPLLSILRFKKKIITLLWENRSLVIFTSPNEVIMKKQTYFRIYTQNVAVKDLLKLDRVNCSTHTM